MNPDFSSTGGAIDFGFADFMIADPFSATAYVNLYDDVSWTINPTPEPNLLCVLGIGALALGAMKMKHFGRRVA